MARPIGIVLTALATLAACSNQPAAAPPSPAASGPVASPTSATTGQDLTFTGPVAGRLTAAEFDERTGQALTARTWGELTELLADLPATRPAPQVPAASPPSARPLPSSGRVAPPIMTALTGLVIAALVLVVATGGWGLIWLLVPALLIARRSICPPGASTRCGKD